MQIATQKTAEQFEVAGQVLAGGVSASIRLNRALGRPMYFDRAEGCRLWDLDGREYLDLCTSHGATLLGHGDPRVRAAVEAVLARGAACSYENELHAELARCICQTVPCCERVRFTGSGTEATLHCIRLARAFTGRPKLLKFEGNFHGYHDQVMFSLGTPADRLGPEDAPTPYPASAGLTRGIEEQLVLAPYNRTELFEAIFQRHAGELAAVICEPVWYNAGCIVPTPDFMAALRRPYPEARRALDLRRGAELLPHGAGRRPGVPGRDARSVHAWARRWGAAFPSAPLAAGARSWTG